MKQRLDLGIRRLQTKLEVLDRKNLKISDYSKHYLAQHMLRITPSLQEVAHVLYWSQYDGGGQANGTGLVDYGGGIGLLALLAKELDVGPVVYVDIDDQSCRDAQHLAHALGLQAQYYFNGDIDELHRRVRRHAIQCSSLASFDVIEHVYDVRAFLEAVSALPSKRLRLAIGSAANPLNPLIRRRLTAFQREYEIKDRAEIGFGRSCDSLRAFLGIRADIIREYAPTLSPLELGRLAKLTRGRMRQDIEACVEAFQSTGNYPPEPKHPTNTCDPTNGNWVEQLLDPHELAGLLSSSGLSSAVEAGRYGRHPDWKKRVVGALLNVLIENSGPWGLRLAPYYILRGARG